MAKKKTQGWLDEYDAPQAQNGIEGTMGGLTDKGFDYNGAWGGQFQNGGGLTFLEPNSSKLPLANNRSELAMSIGGEQGEPAYLIPSFKYGEPILGPSNSPIAEFRRTGEHLGGPFKTWQEADEWERTVRHPYVEKGQSIPTPIRRWGRDYQLGGNVYPVNYVPQAAMGGSTGGTFPGSTGFMYARTQGAAPSEGPYAKKTMPSAQNGRTFLETASNFIPFYETYVDIKDAIMGGLTGDRARMNQGIFGLGSPSFSGKALTSSLDYLTEKGLGKDIADYNEEKRNELINMSERDRQKLFEKYGPGGYDKWKKAGKPKLEYGGMSFYQHGLDWKPRNISRKGSVIKDDRGQWAHPGKITEISSPNITMQGVPYPVLGIGKDGQQIMMQPGQDYKFNKAPVTEIPMAQTGVEQTFQEGTDFLRDWYSKRAQLPQFQDLATRRLQDINRFSYKLEPYSEMKNVGVGYYPHEGGDIVYVANPEDPTIPEAKRQEYIPTKELIGHELTHGLTRRNPQIMPEGFFTPIPFEQFDIYNPEKARHSADEYYYNWINTAAPIEYTTAKGKQKTKMAPGAEVEGTIAMLRSLEKLDPLKTYTPEDVVPMIEKYKTMRERAEKESREGKGYQMENAPQMIEFMFRNYNYNPKKIASLLNELVKTGRTDVPIAQDGNDIPRSDSVILRNNALAKINFYKNNPKYEKSTQLSTSPKLFSPKALTRLAKDSVKLSKSKNSINSLNWAYATQEERPFDEKQTRNRLGKVKGASTLYKSPDFEYDFIAKVLSPDAAQIDTYYNPDSPPIYFSDRIVPQGVDLYKSGYYGDISITPYYDPLAVSPWDMLTPKEQKLRLKKYGPSGTPYANPKPKEESKLKRIPHNPETIKSTRSEASPIQISPIAQASQAQMEVPDWQYRVEYTDPDTGQKTHRMFNTEKEGSEFQRMMGGERIGSWEKQPKKKTGGWLDKYN